MCSAGPRETKIRSHSNVVRIVYELRTIAIRLLLTQSGANEEIDRPGAYRAILPARTQRCWMDGRTADRIFGDPRWSGARRFFERMLGLRRVGDDAFALVPTLMLATTVSVTELGG